MMSPVNPQPPSSGNDEQWMQYALHLAEQAASVDEVPVGAVLVHENKVIGEGYNQPIALSDPTAHAEIIALRAAGKVIGNYRLPGSTLYVTLEPCSMCAGAMLHARIERLVFGARDPKTGVVGGVMNLFEVRQWNHQVACTPGVLEEPCRKLLQSFFKAKRQK